jgi:uncharacterized protein
MPKPKNVRVIEGFPGFGLVGTITTGFLVDHLKCDLLEQKYFEDIAPTVAVHGGKVVEPIGVYYNKKHNIIIIHSIMSPLGLEWKAAEFVARVCKDYGAKELITIEGVGTQGEATEQRAFYYCRGDDKKIKATGVQPLGEGIIIGVTGALLMKPAPCPTIALFAETHSSLPDSKAAAMIIQVLDKYLGLDVDSKPLLKQAEAFEAKLKTLMQQSAGAQEQQERKALSYIS